MSMIGHFIFIPMSILVWIGKIVVDLVVNFWWVLAIWYCWALYKYNNM